MVLQRKVFKNGVPEKNPDWTHYNGFKFPFLGSLDNKIFKWKNWYTLSSSLTVCYGITFDQSWWHFNISNWRALMTSALRHWLMDNSSCVPLGQKNVRKFISSFDKGQWFKFLVTLVSSTISGHHLDLGENFI